MDVIEQKKKAVTCNQKFITPQSFYPQKIGYNKNCRNNNFGKKLNSLSVKVKKSRICE